MSQIMRFAMRFIGALAIAGAGLVAACAGSPTKPSPTAMSLTVDGARTIREGESLTLTATAHFSDGSTQAVTNGVTWTSDDPRIATVDTRGVVTGVSAGQSQIHASFKSASGAAPLRVAAAARSVSGRVHESFPTDSVAIAGAAVTVVGADGAMVSATTDASGAFTISVVPGVAQVTVAAAGYETSTTNTDLTAGDASLALAPALQEVRESFDYIPYPGPRTSLDARSFKFNVHHAGKLYANFTQTRELASAQASTCIKVRDSENRVLQQVNGWYDHPAGPLVLGIIPGVYTVTFTSCNVNGYASWTAEDMNRWGGEITHPN